MFYNSSNLCCIIFKKESKSKQLNRPQSRMTSGFCITKGLKYWVMTFSYSFWPQSPLNWFPLLVVNFHFHLQQRMFPLNFYLYIYIYKLHFQIPIQHVNAKNKAEFGLLSHTAGWAGQAIWSPLLCGFPVPDTSHTSLVFQFLISCLFYHRTQSQIPKKSQNTKY